MAKSTRWHYFILFVLVLLSGQISYGATPLKVSSGQFLIFDNTLYLVEGKISEESGKQWVSLIPLPPDVTNATLKTAQDSSTRLVGQFPAEEFDFADSVQASPIDFNNVLRLDKPIEHLPPPHRTSNASPRASCKV